MPDKDCFQVLDEMLTKDGYLCIHAKEACDLVEDCPHGKPHFLLATCYPRKYHRCLKSGFGKTKCQKTIPDKAIDELYKTQPPGGKYSKKQLPSIPVFRDAYFGLLGNSGIKKKWCPCCDGSGWLVNNNPIDGRDYARACHCRTGSDRDFRACSNHHCQNPEYKSRLEFSAGFANNQPHRFYGFKWCSYNPSITEEARVEVVSEGDVLAMVGDMPYLPEVPGSASNDKDDDIPF